MENRVVSVRIRQTIATFRLDGRFQSPGSKARGKDASLIIDYSPSLLPHSYFQSGSSGCFRSQSGRRLRTIGSVSKLYSGGGEVVVHSSVQASQGSSPASAPRRRETSRLATKQRRPRAWKSAPTEEIRL